MMLAMYPFKQGICQPDNQKYRSAFKVNLSSLMNSFSFPSLEVGYERFVSNKFSIQAELGMPIYKYNNQGYYTSKPDTSFGKSIGFTSNMELRKYRFKDTSSRKLNMYLALNLALATHQTNIGMDYMVDSSITLVDNFFLKRREFGVTPNAGMKWYKKWFMFELYLGLGYTYYAIQNQHREYDALIHTLPNQLHNIAQIGETNLSENQGWRLIPKIGFRVGVRI